MRGAEMSEFTSKQSVLYERIKVLEDERDEYYSKAAAAVALLPADTLVGDLRWLREDIDAKLANRDVLETEVAALREQVRLMRSADDVLDAIATIFEATYDYDARGEPEGEQARKWEPCGSNNCDGCCGPETGCYLKADM
jgi:hypothetical protein